MCINRNSAQITINVPLIGILFCVTKIPGTCLSNILESIELDITNKELKLGFKISKQLKPTIYNAFSLRGG